MEWITAREAISILAAHCEGYGAEVDALRLGAATGAFAVKAGQMVKRVKPGLLGEEGSIETNTDWPVPLEVWGGLILGLHGGFEHGNLELSPDWRTTIKLTGLRFEKARLLNYAAAMGKPANSNKVRRERDEEGARRSAEWLSSTRAILDKSEALLAGRPTAASIERAGKLDANPGQAISTAPKPRGRPKGVGGFHAADKELVAEMHRLIEAGEAEGRWDAAMKLADAAKGGGTFDAKARRLLERYNEAYPA
jgi:hypothetical protein